MSSPQAQVASLYYLLVFAYTFLGFHILKQKLRDFQFILSNPFSVTHEVPKLKKNRIPHKSAMPWSCKSEFYVKIKASSIRR